MAKVSPAEFVNQVRQEVSKVTWPSRKETLLTTMMVLFIAVIASIFFLAADSVLSFVVGKILAIGG
jgi:preprotein translocase subunit SecE